MANWSDFNGVLLLHKPISDAEFADFKDGLDALIHLHDDDDFLDEFNSGHKSIAINGSCAWAFKSDDAIDFCRKWNCAIEGTDNEPGMAIYQAFDIDGDPDTLRVCDKCGSHNVAELIWHNPNNKQIISDMDAGREGLSDYCFDCENTTNLVPLSHFNQTKQNEKDNESESDDEQTDHDQAATKSSTSNSNGHYGC